MHGTWCIDIEDDSLAVWLKPGECVWCAAAGILSPCQLYHLPPFPAATVVASIEELQKLADNCIAWNDDFFTFYADVSVHECMF